MDKVIWRLSARSENHLYLVLAESKNNFAQFDQQFLGKPLVNNWQAPKVEIEKKRKHLLDFVSLDLGVPVISEKSRLCLSPLISPYAEILPLIEIYHNSYYVINVTCVVNCLDHENCVTITNTPAVYGDNHFQNIISYAFRTDYLPEVPIFKVPENLGIVFVQQSFVNAVIKGNLRGAVLSDPVANPLTAIMAGKTGNIVPELPE